MGGGGLHIFVKLLGPVTNIDYSIILLYNILYMIIRGVEPHDPPRLDHASDVRKYSHWYQLGNVFLSSYEKIMAYSKSW